MPEIAELTRRAEDAGFDTAWMAETRMTRDGFVPMAAMATATSRIRIGSGIVNVYTRNPVVLAISFVGLEELAPGRILLGLGPGSPNVLRPQGIAFEKPLTRLREYCEVIPRLIAGEQVTFEGETVRLDGAQIEDLLSGDGTVGGPRSKLPLWLGVTGPRSMEWAGEVADGVLMNACLPVEYVHRSRELVARGARRAGRDPEAIELQMAVPTCVMHDSAAAKRGAARFVALYLSLFPNIARETGLDETWVERLRATFGERGLEAASELVGDDVVDRVAVAGSPAECRVRLDEYRAAGIAVPVVAPLENTIDLVLAELA